MIAAGQRVGPYEIVQMLGAGGMGEVYRARDPRLGRDVALKLLHPTARLPDSIARFEQEARAASVLNHPGILAVYDIGSHEDSPYVVSELLEGETLRARLQQGALPRRKAIELGMQAAHALAAAHEKGIVHRDVKPENLFITRDGRLKILDFGLAKLLAPGGGDSGDTAALSPGAVATSAGMIMGTPGYMAPEQVRALPTDERTDIFALGAVIYEMLSGRRAFAGATMADALSAILREEPPELWRDDASIPATLDRVVRRCLEKRAEDRFHSARDLAFALEATEEPSGAHPPAVAPPRARRAWARRLLAVAGIGLALAASFLAGRGRETTLPVYRRLTSSEGTIFEARFGRDSGTTVYSAAWKGRPQRVFVRVSDAVDATPLLDGEAELLSVSSSGEVAVKLRARPVAPFVTRGTLARVAVTGGAPREVMDDVSAADWAPDGSALAVVRETATGSRLEFPAGKVLFETAGSIRSIRFSPGGERIAFRHWPIRETGGGTLMVADVAGTVRTLDGEAGQAGLAWSRDGKEVLTVRSTTLVARSLEGGQRPLLRLPMSASVLDASPDGKLLITLEDRHVLLLGAGSDPTVAPRDLSWLHYSLAGDISADGQRVLFTEGALGQASLRGTDGSPVVALGEGSGVALSPDGKWALTSQPDHLTLIPTGAGEPRVLPKGPIVRYGWGGWSPDGRQVAFAGTEAGAGIRLYLQDVAGGAPRSISGEGIGFGNAVFSADATRVLVSGPDRIPTWYPVNGGAPEPLRGGGPDDRPLRLGSDGVSLFLMKFGDWPLRVWRLDLATGRRELVREVAAADPTGVFLYGPAQVTPDGRHVVASAHRLLSRLVTVEGVAY